MAGLVTINHQIETKFFLQPSPTLVLEWMVNVNVRLQQHTNNYASVLKITSFQNIRIRNRFDTNHSKQLAQPDYLTLILNLDHDILDLVP